MSIWKMAVACSLTVGVMTGQIGQASAAPMPTNVATMKAAAGDDVTQVHWRGGGWGWGLGGFALHLLRRRVNPSLDQAALLSLSYAATIVVCLWLIVQFPFRLELLP